MDRTLSICAAGVLVAGVVASASCPAQTAFESPAGRGVAGFLDPATGVFTSLPFRGPAAAPDAIPEANVTYTGTFKFVFAITMKSTLSAAIICSATATLLAAPAAGVPSTITETKTVTATKNGTTASCTVSIPYSWLLASPATSQVMLSYNTASEPAGVTRSQFVSLGTITMPANGVVTTRNVAVTL